MYLIIKKGFPRKDMLQVSIRSESAPTSQIISKKEYLSTLYGKIFIKDNPFSSLIHLT
jgi:hypothetical protein